ncbi:MAG TPA: HAMP domain-containing sensor histidine kinase [Magnetospirillaceae bacterium]|jgi:two-component system sensor histidine kinase ChvG
MIAQALLPVLDRPDARPKLPLDTELSRFGGDGTILKLMFQPKGPGHQSFYYVGSSPKATQDQIGVELDSLAEHGILQQLEQTCTWDENVAIRYKEADGKEDILTSVIPIRSRWGCWVLVSSHVASEFMNMSIGRPYWQSREVRITAALYLVVAILGILIAMSVWRSVREFRDVAKEVRRGRVGESAFVDRNVVPELDSVAADFDGLVGDLHRAARDIRQAAEENAHSLKTPLATIQSSLDPIRRVVPEDNDRAKRAMELIEASLARLRLLISASQRMDHNIADLILSPRDQIDLTQVVTDTLNGWRDTLVEHDVRLHWHLDSNALIQGARSNVEVIIENILDNAVSFSPAGSIITVRLIKTRKSVDLMIEDSGPGIDPEKLEQVFERHFSLRPSEHEDGAAFAKAEKPEHAGLGMWIVRRNVELLGGKVSAMNRPGGGLTVKVSLPLYGSGPSNSRTA